MRNDAIIPPILIPIILALIGAFIAFVYGYPTLIPVIQEGASTEVCPVDLGDYNYGGEYIQIKNRGKIASVTLNFNYRTKGALSLIDDIGNPTNSSSGSLTVDPDNSVFFRFKPSLTNTSVGAKSILQLYIDGHLDIFRFLPPRNGEFFIECRYVSRGGTVIYLTESSIVPQ